MTCLTYLNLNFGFPIHILDKFSNIINECKQLRYFTIDGHIRNEEYITFLENIIEKIMLSEGASSISTLTLILPSCFKIQDAQSLKEIVEQEQLVNEKLKI
jgi:hypothetical protein